MASFRQLKRIFNVNAQKMVLMTLFISTIFLLSRCSSSEGTATVYLNHADSVSYVGKAVCKSCHPDKFETFIETGMGQSFKHARKDLSAAKNAKPSIVFDSTNGMFYFPHWQGEELWILEFSMLGGDTIHKLDVKVDYIIGSGQHTNSHLVQVGSYIYQAPITYYSQEGKWDLPPGFEGGNNSRFTRVIDVECMSCHNAMPSMHNESAQQFASIGHGIDCERCHGPGSLHLQWRTNDQLKEGQSDLSIVNPAKLSLERQIDLCQRCHLQGLNLLREGKSFTDFRPGMRLSDFFEIYLPDYSNNGQELDMANHAARFQMSDCFVASSEQDAASFTCISCHNPHISVKETKHELYNSTCMNCHVQSSCSKEEKLSLQADDCVACHMPQTATQDIQHVQIHDHYIRKPLTAEKSAKVQQLIGLYAVNNSQPEHHRLTEAYLLYWEKFDKNPFYLTKAKEQLDKEGRADLWLKYYYLSEDYKSAWGLKGELKDVNAWQAYMLGEAALSIGKREEAQAYLALSLKLDPDLVDVGLKLIRLQVQEGLLGKAEKNCRMLLASFPRHGLLWNQLAGIQLRIGITSGIEHTLQKALKWEPIALEVWEMHLNYALAIEDQSTATIWAKRIRNAYPNHPDTDLLNRVLEASL